MYRQNRKLIKTKINAKKMIKNDVSKKNTASIIKNIIFN